MVTGEGSIEMEEDVTTADDVDINLKTDKYIMKPRRNKKERVCSDKPGPKCPSYLRRKSLPGRFPGPERKRRGGEYRLGPAPRPSFPGHEELRPPSRAASRAASRDRHGPIFCIDVEKAF